MSVFNFGSLNIDHVYRLDHITQPGETIADQGLKYMPGGKGLNQSIALAMSGAEVYHVGCVGNDGNYLVELLNKNGVQTHYLKTVEEPNGHAIIQVSREGQNSIIIHGGSNRCVTAEQVDNTMDVITPQDIVLIQNEISQIPYIVKQCGDRKIPLAFNPSPFTPELLDEVPFEAVTYLLINETEGYQLTQETSPDKIVDSLLKRFPQMHIVLTLGAAGVLYADRFKRLQMAGFHVHAVDTTGAGDTFTGFFIGFLAQGHSIELALRYGCAAAAISVTVNGAATSVPELSTVQEFLANFDR